MMACGALLTTFRAPVAAAVDTTFCLTNSFGAWQIATNGAGGGC